MLGLRLLLLKLLSLAFILYYVAASFRKMSLTKQRKVDKECRVFQHSWSVAYLFTEVNAIPACLVCSQQVSVVNKYNIQRHYETHHADRYLSLQGQPRRGKVKELIADLKKQKSVFTSNRDISAAALMASYLIANGIALASKPCCEGEFVKTCILKAAEIVCSEKLKLLLILA